MYIFSKKTRLGFTLVEILVVIGIIFLLSIITFSSFSNLNKKELLDKESLKVLSIIQDARSLTLSSKNSSQYGVYFEGDKVTFFAGDSYNPLNSDNLITDLSSQVIISSINLDGGGLELVFERLNGRTQQFGTVVMELVSDSSSSKTIRVFETGLSEIE